MDRIIKNIWLGNSHDAIHSLHELKKHGITAVMNCARDLDNPNLSFKDFELSHCGFVDGGGNTVQAAYAAVIHLANLVNKGHQVLIHCHEGKSRSAVVLVYYIYAMQYPAGDLETIIQRMKEKRPRVDIALGLIETFDKMDMELLSKIVKGG